MSSLIDLELTGNHLTRIPDEIAQLSNLEELRLGRNPIKAVSPRLAELPRLKHLYLTTMKKTSACCRRSSKPA